MQQTRKPGPQRALVLAGGGAKGSYQVGVWQALQELGWTPDIITGASVGALNGCLFTMGKSKEAEDLWRGLEIHDVLEVPASLKPEELNNFFLDVVRSGGLNVEPLAETIDRLIDEDAVRRSPIRFDLVMTELGTMRRVQSFIVPQQRNAAAMKDCTQCWHLKFSGRMRRVGSLPVWPKSSSRRSTSTTSLTLNSNTGPVGRSLRSTSPRMPQRRYSFWAKAATPSFSVCRTMPRSSKYLPKQATA